MPALMLHGAGGGAWEWDVWRRVFEAARIAVTAPQLVASSAGLAATRWDDYLQQCTEAATTLAPPRVLVGASLGGLLALAASTRVDCAALVLVNPLPPRPEAAHLPARDDHPTIVPWARDASLAGTRRALPDADAATCAFAFRRWRDESGPVLNAARAGISLAPPRCPILVFASDSDDDVPAAVSTALAARLSATLLRVPDSHVGPLLGRAAASRASAAVHWLKTLGEFRTD
jgi:pimeloyl-ACP methyl ester carboxylesterase